MSAPIDWRPGASLATLRARARALAAVRSFFAGRNVLEVETPVIVSHAVTEPQLASIHCRLLLRPEKDFFLHTSPEFHMKRLLAAGAPDLYQICKAFRDGELGSRHQPEFTIIEWYRLGFTVDDLIEDVCNLVQTVAHSLGRTPFPLSRHSYRELFLDHAGFDPITADSDEIQRQVSALLHDAITPSLRQRLGNQRNAWLDLVMVSTIEPALRGRGLVVVKDYPAAQAGLARLNPANAQIAHRFEVYLDGLELANGYHELSDAMEQEARFAGDRKQRRAAGLADRQPDPALIAALHAGLPDCCGVALGFDRLLMACLGLGDMREAVAFCVPEG